MKLLAEHFKMLEDLCGRTYPDGEMCAHFAAFIEPDRDRQKVRRIIRSLARRGFAEYHRGLWTEDGEPAGAGYCITRAGIDALEADTE